MADDLLLRVLEILVAGVLGTLLGAVLSPWVSQFFQDRSQRRSRLRDFLDPIYDYEDGLRSHEPEVWLGPEPWASITPSIRERLKAKELSAIDRLAAAAKEFEAALWTWNRHADVLMASGLRATFDESFKQYMDVHYKVTGAKVGHAANWELNDDQLFRRIYPHLVRHLDHAKEGWDEVLRSSWNHGSYVDIIVAAIARGDPKVLDRVYEVCTTHQMFKESLDAVRDLDAKHAALLREAEVARRVLKP